MKHSLPESSAVTMLSFGTVLDGNLSLEGDTRIDGVVNGSIVGKKRVVIGEKAVVKGDVVCDFLELHGDVKGNVSCKTAARLHATAVLEGDLQAPQFSVDMGAIFYGMSKRIQDNLNETSTPKNTK